MAQSWMLLARVGGSAAEIWQQWFFRPQVLEKSQAGIPVACSVLFWGVCFVLGALAVQRLPLLWGTGCPSVPAAGCDFGPFLGVSVLLWGWGSLSVPSPEPWGPWQGLATVWDWFGAGFEGIVWACRD